jgi:hypothetical protein
VRETLPLERSTVSSLWISSVLRALPDKWSRTLGRGRSKHRARHAVTRDDGLWRFGLNGANRGDHEGCGASALGCS